MPKYGLMTSFSRGLRDDIRSLPNRFAHSLEWYFLPSRYSAPCFQERIANCAGTYHRLLSLAWCSLCAEGDDGVDGRGSAGGKIAG
jgi:hypothetical protein